jgi:hypothetical protein
VNGWMKESRKRSMGKIGANGGSLPSHEAHPTESRELSFRH